MKSFYRIFTMTFIRIFLCLMGCSLTLFSQPSFQRTIHDDSLSYSTYHIDTIDHKIHNLNVYVDILKEDRPLLIDEIGQKVWDTLFKPWNEGSTDCAACIYWARINIKNDTKSDLKQWILYLGIASSVHAYIFDEGDKLKTEQQSGRGIAAKLKNLKSGNRLERILLNIGPNEEQQIYVRIQNTNGYSPKINMALSSEDYNKSDQYNKQRILDGLFIGFLLSLMVFNILFFITTRDIAFLYQFIFVTCILIFMLDIMDLISDFPIILNHPRALEPINFTALIGLNISYLLFVNKFIQVESIFPKWFNIFKKLIQLNLILGAGIVIFYFLTLNERITDTAIALISVVQYGFLLVLLFKFLKIRDKKSYFILIATFFLIGGVLVDGTCIAMGIGVPIDFSKFVVLGNVSFFFVGLAYRMKLLKEEEHEAIRQKENQELKNQLYTNITHEFRTPLTVIQGMALQIESNLGNSGSGILKQSIQLVKSNGVRLLQLVNTILDLAKLDSGKMTLTLEQDDIISFLRYQCSLFEEYARSKKIYLQFLTDRDRLQMDFDKEKIRQIISNLISNAIKFTPPDGKILFSVSSIEHNQVPCIQMEVKDTGIGIPKSEISNLFDRFFQSKGSTQVGQGSGLGLALVHELVKLMNGQIIVESDVGIGTSFKILIPNRTIQLLAPLNESANENKQESLGLKYSDHFDKKEHGLNESNDIKGRLKMKFPEHSENETPVMLIIDDNSDIVYYLKRLFEHLFVLETAFNGMDGIAIALEVVPDIIISDIMMPGRDGIDLCDSLKNDDRTSHIPIILLTAKADISARVLGIRKGADAYISKPFEEAELKAQVDNLLMNRKSLQNHFISLFSKPSDPEEVPKPKEDAFIIKLNSIIENNIEDEDFGVTQLCRALQMSRTQLHRKITALTNKSTSIYVRSVRLQKSKLLLKNPEMNISQVAFAVGYSDPNYFSRTFTEEFGITPSAYKAGN